MRKINPSLCPLAFLPLPRPPFTLARGLRLRSSSTRGGRRDETFLANSCHEPEESDHFSPLAIEYSTLFLPFQPFCFLKRSTRVVHTFYFNVNVHRVLFDYLEEIQSVSNRSLCLFNRSIIPRKCYCIRGRRKSLIVREIMFGRGERGGDRRFSLSCRIILKSRSWAEK